ncbi:SDR family oxidoreductase [Parasphingorhabdus pacifica]
MGKALEGTVALVAGATRGAGRGIAVELGAAGATVYATGRTTRYHRSDYGRSETIEDTAELVDAAGGRGVAVPVDHTDTVEVGGLVDRIRAEQGRLDVLVNDLGGEHLMEWNVPIWRHSLDKGLRRLRTGIEAHMITSHFALGLLVEQPGGLVVEVTDGTAEYNERNYRTEGGAFFDLAKVAAHRMAFGLAEELRPHDGVAVSLTPGWLRSEMMLDEFGVTEDDWRAATVDQPHFCISETPAFVGRAVVALAGDPERQRWNGQSLSSGGLAPVYGFDDVDGTRPDAWRYIVEVAQAGKPADDTGYR